MTPLKALVFDVDGTLADTERDGHRVAYNRAFAAIGLDWDWDIALYGELLTVTGGKERIKHYIDQYQANVPGTDDLSAWIADLHKLKTRYYTEIMREKRIPLRPGVRRLLVEARQQEIRLAIATTTTPENVTELLHSTLGSEGPFWFDIIAAGDVVAKKKPAPDIYYFILEKLGLPASACLAIEDSENGLKSSHVAGLNTLVTVNGYTQGQRFNDAVAVIDQLGEPDSPMKVLAGSALNGASFVDMSLLKMLHGIG